METPITILQRHFGLSDFNDEALAYFASRSWDDWHEFAVLYQEQYADNFLDINRSELTRGEDESAPYLFEKFFYGDELARPTWDSLHAHDSYIEALKRLLLFHHRVFLPDWFLWQLDFARLYTSDSDRAKAHILSINKYIRLLAVLKPLFDEGIVNFIPTPAPLLNGQSAGRYDVPIDREWLQLLASAKGDKKFGVYERAAKRRLDKIFLYLECANSLGLDIILPNRQTSNLFHHAITRTVEPSIHTTESFVMPGVERLRIEDLVTIRKNDCDFENWRTELRQIQQIARIDPKALQYPDQFAKDASARLRNRREAIEKGAVAKSFATEMGANVTNIGLGMLGAFAGNLIAPETGAASSVIGTFLCGSTGVALKSIDHLAKRKKRDTLVRLYSVFDYTSKV